MHKPRQAAAVLRSLTDDPDAVLAAVNTTVAPGEVEPTPRVIRAIELADEEVRSFGHHYLGTEHILLGLTGIESNRQVLDRVYGAVAEIRRLREEMARTLSAGSEQTTTAAESR